MLPIRLRAGRSTQRGGTLIVVLFLSTATLALGLMSAVSARTELRIAHNGVIDLQAFNIAEAGMNAAVKLIGNHYSFNDELANNGTGACVGNGVGNTSSGLASIGDAATLASDGNCYRFAAFGGTSSDGYYVRVEDNLDETSGGDDPTTDTDGTIRLIVHGKMGTAERIVAGTLTLGGYGVFGINGITMSGGSKICSGNAVSCTIASSTARAGSNGTIALSGSNTTIMGNASAGATLTTNGGATVTGTTTNHAAPVSFPAVTACGGPYSSSAGITLGSHASYNSATGALSVSGGGTVTLAAGTYCFSSVTLTGNSTLSVSGATTINMTGPWDTSGGSVANSSSDPNNLVVNSSYSCSGSSCIKITGGTGNYMKLNAPSADVVLSGGSTFHGSFIGRSIDISGGASIIQNGLTGAMLANWHEVK